MASFSRRQVNGILAAMTVAVVASVTAQSSFPSRPIRLIVPYPPGGFTDILGRLIAQRLSPLLGQPVVVDNKGGGGSTIGSAIVAKAPADGYTLLLVAPDFAINESLIPQRLTYDARKDFAPVIQAAWSPMVLVTHPSVQAKSVAELIALAKSKPGKISFASGGAGSGSHLAIELFKSRAGVDVIHVPYKGNGPATTDLIGGQVAAMFLQYAVARPHIEAGKLRVLGTPSGKRSPAMPDIPTLAESGLPGFDVQPWFGIVAPAGTPVNVVMKLNTEIATVMRQPDLKKQLSDEGAEAVVSTPEQFGQFITAEISRWGIVVKESGAKAD